MNTKYIHIGKSTILWEKTSFSRAFKFLKNNSLSRAELSDDNGNVKNIHYGDILIKFSECLYADEGNNIPYIINDNIAYKLLKLSPLINGDIVFADAAEDNTVGKCIEIITHNDTDLVAGLHTIPCRPTIKFAEGYLGYYLNSTAFHNQLLQYIQGTKISSISKKSICQTIISYPSEIINQQKIASYFQSLDSLIQSTSKKLASLKRIKAASLQSMFPQKGETVPKVRFKGFEGKWKNLTLGEIGKWSKGRLLSKSDLTADGKNPCIHYGELFVNYSEVINEVESYTNVDNGCYSEIGDILFPDSDVTATGLARCSAIMQNGVILGGGINILKVDKKFYSPYISYSINQEKGQIISRVIGTTVRHINSTALSEVQIAVPSDIKEQQQIVDYFTCLDKQITLQAQRLEKLKQIKAACLDKMFV